MLAKGLSMIDSAGAQALGAAERAANMAAAPQAAPATAPASAVATPIATPSASPVAADPPARQQPSGYAMPTGNVIDRLANKVNDMADQALGQANKDLKDSRASLVPADYSGPPGLALLALPRQVRLKQKVEAVEVLAAWASKQGSPQTANPNLAPTQALA
jgi:hypothetical protein